MTSLSEILASKFPGKGSGPLDTRDYVLRDDADGNGPHIVLWNVAELGPEPDAQTLAQWELEYQPPVVALTAAVVAQARLVISGDDIEGVDVSAGFGAAMLLDTGTFWLFFTTPQADDHYLVFAQPRGSNLFADVTDANTDYVEIIVKDRDDNPVTPEVLFLSIQRAQ